MVLSNTGDNSLSIGVRMAARGPNACELQWEDQMFDFPLVDISLAPEQSYEYKQQWRFFEPGVYFAEPVKRYQGQWGGIRPFPRQYFIVAEDTTVPTPRPDCRS